MLRRNTRPPSSGKKMEAASSSEMVVDLSSYRTCPNVKYYNLNTAVAQFVEALRYKPERRGFDSRWSHWNFSLT
jgi:hypothetical protein